MNVWRRVRQYVTDGQRTSIIHGKYAHEETRATSSRAREDGAHYLVVRDHAEAQLVCDMIRGAEGALGRDEFLSRFEPAISPGFDPTVPGVAARTGGLHPITQITLDLNDAFATLGFEVYAASNGLVAREVDGRYQLAFGERRLRAAKQAQIETIPIDIVTEDLNSAYIIAEFMLNLLPIPNLPTRHQVEAYIRQHFRSAEGGFCFSTDQTLVQIRYRFPSET